MIYCKVKFGGWGRYQGPGKRCGGQTREVLAVERDGTRGRVLDRKGRPTPRLPGDLSDRNWSLLNDETGVRGLPDPWGSRCEYVTYVVRSEPTVVVHTCARTCVCVCVLELKSKTLISKSSFTECRRTQCCLVVCSPVKPGGRVSPPGFTDHTYYVLVKFTSTLLSRSGNQSQDLEEDRIRHRKPVCVSFEGPPKVVAVGEGRVREGSGPGKGTSTRTKGRCL